MLKRKIKQQKFTCKHSDFKKNILKGNKTAWNMVSKARQHNNNTNRDNVTGPSSLVSNPRPIYVIHEMGGSSANNFCPQICS